MICAASTKALAPHTLQRLVPERVTTWQSSAHHGQPSEH